GSGDRKQETEEATGASRRLWLLDCFVASLLAFDGGCAFFIVFPFRPKAADFICFLFPVY
ncbi:MAG: hypothetical protein LBF93_10735, partial [Zoogloeaceae bacterium]|nr:hypothetical protein [Zoogloeaceae bacterium]